MLFPAEPSLQPHLSLHAGSFVWATLLYATARVYKAVKPCETEIHEIQTGGCYGLTNRRLCITAHVKEKLVYRLQT